MLINKVNLRTVVERACIQQDFAEAERLLGDAMQSGQADSEVYYLHAGVAGYQGDFESAERYCRQALELQPDYFEALFRLANSLDALEKKTEALKYFDRALRLQPTFFHAWNNCGACHLSLENYADAKSCFQQAIALNDSLAVFHTNLALALVNLGEFAALAEVLAKIEQTADNELDLQYFLTLIGLNCRERQQAEWSIRLFKKVVAVDDSVAENWLNLGLAYIALNQTDEALTALTRARELDPEHIEVLWTLAGLYLLLGDYDKGLPLYEYRWKRKDNTIQENYQPQWQGESLQGKTLYVYPEQGYGDCIQFIRYVRHIKQQGATTIVECPPALYRLFECVPGIDTLIKSGAIYGGFYDYAVSIGSLPLRCNGFVANVPATIPYIDRESLQARSLPARQARQLRAGLVWAGNPQHPNDKNRSMPWAQVSTLLQLDGVQWFSLQMGDAAQAAGFQGLENLIDCTEQITDFYDSAEILLGLDVMICVDTSVAHLAGALGVNTWLLLPFAPDWRWGLDSAASVWYDNVRLFRQKRVADWGSVVQEVQDAILQTQATMLE